MIHELITMQEKCHYPFIQDDELLAIIFDKLPNETFELKQEENYRKSYMIEAKEPDSALTPFSTENPNYTSLFDFSVSASPFTSLRRPNNTKNKIPLQFTSVNVIERKKGDSGLGNFATVGKNNKIRKKSRGPSIDLHMFEPPISAISEDGPSSLHRNDDLLEIPSPLSITESSFSNRLENSQIEQSESSIYYTRNIDTITETTPISTFGSLQESNQCKAHLEPLKLRKIAITKLRPQSENPQYQEQPPLTLEQSTHMTINEKAVMIQGVFKKRDEFNADGSQSTNDDWVKHWVVLNGTILSLYPCQPVPPSHQLSSPHSIVSNLKSSFLRSSFADLFISPRKQEGDMIDKSTVSLYPEITGLAAGMQSKHAWGTGWLNSTEPYSSRRTSGSPVENV